MELSSLILGANAALGNFTMIDLMHCSQALAGCPIGHPLIHRASLTSTMAYAHTLARQPATPSGALVVAEAQSAGRGRQGRRWEAPSGLGLLTTIILKAPYLPADPTEAPLLAGVALARSVEEVAPTLAGRVRLKWPNDLLLPTAGSSMAKTAGILIESAFVDGELAYLLLGIGVNVNQTEADFDALPPGASPATSLRLTLGAAVDRSALLVALCRQLGRRASRWADAESARAAGDRLWSEWQTLLDTLGREVTVRPLAALGGEEFHGRAVAVDRQGHLLVEDGTGERRAFAAGDVTLRSGG